LEFNICVFFGFVAVALGCSAYLVSHTPIWLLSPLDARWFPREGKISDLLFMVTFTFPISVGVICKIKHFTARTLKIFCYEYCFHFMTMLCKL